MTVLHPPILNLNRLNISSGWPSDFRMSMLLQVLRCCSLNPQDVPHQSAASPRCSSSSSIQRTSLSITRLVRSTDASDWLASHGLSGERPMSDQNVWCDAPPQPTVSAQRLLIGSLFIQEGNHTCSMKLYNPSSLIPAGCLHWATCVIYTI